MNCKTTKEQLQEMADMRADGASYYTIAKKFGLSHVGVMRALRRHQQKAIVPRGTIEEYSSGVKTPKPEEIPFDGNKSSRIIYLKHRWHQLLAEKKLNSSEFSKKST